MTLSSWHIDQLPVKQTSVAEKRARRTVAKEIQCQSDMQLFCLVSGVQNRAELLNKSTPNALTER